MPSVTTIVCDSKHRFLIATVVVLVLGIGGGAFGLHMKQNGEVHALDVDVSSQRESTEVWREAMDEKVDEVREDVKSILSHVNSENQ